MIEATMMIPKRPTPGMRYALYEPHSRTRTVLHLYNASRCVITGNLKLADALLLVHGQEQLAEMRKALRSALEHVAELREAWSRGALSECDGGGGMRSNRNAAVMRLIEESLLGSNEEVTLPGRGKKPFGCECGCMQFREVAYGYYACRECSRVYVDDV